MMPETSKELLGVIKNETIFITGRESKKLFLWVSGTMVENELLKALATAVVSVRVVLLLMIALWNVQLGSFSEIKFLFTSK